MKTKFLLLATTIFTAAVMFTACKKDTSASSATATDKTQVSTQADDETQVSTETEAVSNDATTAMENSASFSGRGEQVQGLLCDATIVIDSVDNPRTITITYNGTNCTGNRSRTGVVIISMAQGVHWKDAGAAVTITFQNLTIVRTRDSKKVILNGSITYTNVSGGLLLDLATLSTITHTITSNGLTITFNNGSQRSWQIAKQRVFIYNSGKVITTTGTYTNGTTTGISEWGTNRYGNAFTTSIAQPLVVTQACDYRLTAGQVVYARTLDTATVTYGLDVTGTPTSCPGTGNYYMEIVWVGPGGATITAILPY